jgi:hypothetical protein
MTEAILLLVIISLVGLIAWMEWNNRKERKTLLNAVMTDNSTDYTNAEMMDKTKIVIPQPTETDLVKPEDLTGEEFKNMIAEELKEE